MKYDSIPRKNINMYHTTKSIQFYKFTFPGNNDVPKNAFQGDCHCIFKCLKWKMVFFLQVLSNSKSYYCALLEDLNLGNYGSIYTSLIKISTLI